MPRRKAAANPPASADDDLFSDVDDLELDESDDEADIDFDDDSSVEDDEVFEEEPEPEPAPKRRGRPRKTPAPVADDDVVVAETPAPKKRGRPAKADPAGAAKAVARKAAAPRSAPVDNPFDTSWLVEHVSDGAGRELTALQVRTMLRTLARDGQMDREVGTASGRYTFKGPNDPLVKKVVRMAKTAPQRGPRVKKADAPVVTDDEAPKKRGRPAKAASTTAPAKKVAAKKAPAKAAATPARRGRPRKVAAE